MSIVPGQRRSLALGAGIAVITLAVIVGATGVGIFLLRGVSVGPSGHDNPSWNWGYRLGTSAWSKDDTQAMRAACREQVAEAVRRPASLRPAEAIAGCMFAIQTLDY